MTAIVNVERVSHRYRDKIVLDDVNLTIASGTQTAMVGPDGVGKSTLLSLLAGVKVKQQGELRVFGKDLSHTAQRLSAQERIAFMPQGLGRNLYPTLSVQENLNFFAAISGVSTGLKNQRIAQLTSATGLEPFLKRDAGKLSGGMKQKLALCAALIKDPDLLILDEPTTGVDPLSRSQFWSLIGQLRQENPKMTVLVATAYMEEAEQFDNIIAIEQGRILAQGTTKEIIRQSGANSLETAYRLLKNPTTTIQEAEIIIPPYPQNKSESVIIAENLTMQFGNFKAVDDVSFTISRGEIFGFIGSNGCGKSTTMKMLTGLLPATSGHATLLGKPIKGNDESVRYKIGYMSQSFTLYNELTVHDNLWLHARLYHLPADTLKETIDATLTEFDLLDYSNEHPMVLPLGIRQRLQLATACLHKPEILILDEPTSGVDPDARDLFWRKLVSLSRSNGVTIFISTHFMNEVDRCDRLAMMHAGKVLVTGTPEALKQRHSTDSLELAFINELKSTNADNILVNKIPSDTSASNKEIRKIEQSGDKRASTSAVQRFWAQFQREIMEILRDRIRLSFALLGPVLLLIALGNGISFDVDKVAFSVLDRDQSLQSRTLIEAFSGSRYFRQTAVAYDENQLFRQLQSGNSQFAIEIPPYFGKDLTHNLQPDLIFLQNGSQTFQAQTSRGYIQSTMLEYMQTQIDETPLGLPDVVPYQLNTRFRFNQGYKSAVAIVPGSIMFILALIPAMLSALAVVREKDTGAIYNLYVTRLTITEYIMGKWMAYALLSFISFLIMIGCAVLLFSLPVRGSFAGLLTGGILFVFSSTAFGVLVSTFAQSQMASLLSTAIVSVVPALQFSGFLFPASTLTGLSYWIGHCFPSLWFQNIMIGCYGKSMPLEKLLESYIALALFSFAYIAIACAFLRKQEP